MKQYWWALVIGGAVILEVLTAPATSSHGWKLQHSGMPGAVQFTVNRSRPGRTWTNSNTVPLSSFQGFSVDMLDHGGPARFEYVHDAGKLVCEGHFAWGRGLGSYTFTANPEFVASLRQLGYGALDADDGFQMMMADVSLDFVKSVSEAGIHASTRQLIDLRTRGVNSNFIRETYHAGYRNLSAQDYMDLRSHGVDGRFLRDLRDYGYDLRSDEIVNLRVHGVRADFMADLKRAGYDLTASEISELGMRGVNSAFLRDLRMYGLRPAASDLVQFRMRGVSADYLKDLADAGYGSLTADEVTDLRSHGVPARFRAPGEEPGLSVHSQGTGGFTPARRGWPISSDVARCRDARS